MSFEEQEAMQIKHGMSFFSEREAILKAAEEGRPIEYYHEHEENKHHDQKQPTIDLKKVKIKIYIIIDSWKRTWGCKSS